MPAPRWPYVSLAVKLGRFEIAGILLDAGFEFDPTERIPLVQDACHVWDISPYGQGRDKLDSKSKDLFRAVLHGMAHTIQAGVDLDRYQDCPAAGAVNHYLGDLHSRLSTCSFYQAEFEEVFENFQKKPCQHSTLTKLRTTVSLVQKIPCTAHAGCRKVNGGI